MMYKLCLTFYLTFFLTLYLLKFSVQTTAHIVHIDSIYLKDTGLLMHNMIFRSQVFQVYT